MVTYTINGPTLFPEAKDAAKVWYVLREPEDVVLTDEGWRPAVEPTTELYEVKPGEIAAGDYIFQERVDVAAYSPRRGEWGHIWCMDREKTWAHVRRMLNRKREHLSVKKAAESLLDPETVRMPVVELELG